MWPTPAALANLAFPTNVNVAAAPTTPSIWDNPFCLNFTSQQQPPSPTFPPLEYGSCFTTDNWSQAPSAYYPNNTGWPETIGTLPVQEPALCQPGPAHHLREYQQLPTAFNLPAPGPQDSFIECLPPSNIPGEISTFSPPNFPPNDVPDPSRMSNSNWGFSGLPPLPRQTEPNSDDYLHSLVTNDFSSPSLPPLSPRLLRPHFEARRHSHRQAEVGLAWDSPTTTRNDSSRGALHDPIHIDLEPTNDSSSPPQSSPITTMPPRTRNASIAEITETIPAKRRRTSQTPSRPTISTKRPAATTSSATIITDSLDDSSDLEEIGVEVVDLADTEEIPQKPVLEPKEDNSVKLGAFQCVICMDDVTALSVTYCGKLRIR